MTPVNSITNLQVHSLPVKKKRAITMPTQFNVEKEVSQPKLAVSLKSPRLETAKKRVPVTPRPVKKELPKATVIPAHQISLTRDTTQAALKKELESVTGRKIPRTRNQTGLPVQYGTKYSSPGRPLKPNPKTDMDKLRSSSGSQQRRISPAIRVINTEKKSKGSKKFQSEFSTTPQEHLETDPSAGKENKMPLF